jgi:arginase family enzyme
MKNETEHFYSGIATFLQSPYITLNEVSQYDVTFLGIPVDYGATYRGGQRYAPRSIREHSIWGQVDDAITGRMNEKSIIDFSNNSIKKSNCLTIGDLGDIAIFPGDAEKTNLAIIQTVSGIRKHSFPLIVGGDHSITYASFVGCKQALEQAGLGPLGILHFDAHLDTQMNIAPFPRIYHGNVFRQLIEEEFLDGRHMISIGTRGYALSKWFDYNQKHGIRFYSMTEIYQRGLPAIFSEIIDYFKANCPAVYVTFDIDCIDPSQCPGTGVPIYGGLLIQDVIQNIAYLSEIPVAAFDLVEVSPPLDTSGITSANVCDLLWQFLAFGFTTNIQKVQLANP